MKIALKSLSIGLRSLKELIMKPSDLLTVALWKLLPIDCIMLHIMLSLLY